jgi:hypothetical protein
MAFNLGHFCFGDDYAASVEAEFTNKFNVVEYTSKIEAAFIRPFQLDRAGDNVDDDSDDE